jgi:hypothetical protein
MVAHWPEMDVDNLVVTTTKKIVKSTTLTQYFINYTYYWVGTYFNYIMENMRHRSFNSFTKVMNGQVATIVQKWIKDEAIYLDH